MQLPWLDLRTVGWPAFPMAGGRGQRNRLRSQSGVSPR
jgi:hypothetical protein